MRLDDSGERLTSAQPPVQAVFSRCSKNTWYRNPCSASNGRKSHYPNRPIICCVAFCNSSVTLAGDRKASSSGRSAGTVQQPSRFPWCGLSSLALRSPGSRRGRGNRESERVRRRSCRLPGTRQCAQRRRGRRAAAITRSPEWRRRQALSWSRNARAIARMRDGQLALKSGSGTCAWVSCGENARESKAHCSPRIFQFCECGADRSLKFR